MLASSSGRQPPFDGQVWHGERQLLDRIAADVRVAEVQEMELSHPVEVDQAGIGNWRPAEAQDLEILDLLQMDQAGIRDLRAREVEEVHETQPLQVDQSGIRDRSTAQVDPVYTPCPGSLHLASEFLDRGDGPLFLVATRL